jgi:predicted peptidase
MKKMKLFAALLSAAVLAAGASFAAMAAEGDLALAGLSIVTAVQDGKNISFNPDVTDYTFNVQSDCYGVKIMAVAPQGASITINGQPATSGVGQIVKIDDSTPSYDIVLETPIPVTVSKGGSSKTYTINVVRDCDTWAYNLFKAGEYFDAANNVTIPYQLYVPTNYDPSRQYPIVFALHGSGQRTQSVDMVLKRYQMATVWAKDSEAGRNECIVLAPQCKMDSSVTASDNWTTLMGYRNGTADNPYTPMKYLEGAYNLLLKTMAEYSVDPSRVYMTGLSSGGFGTYALAIEHPETFAAIAPDAGGADPAKVGALKGIPMWIFHAADDPQVKPDEYYYTTLAALNAAGIPYRTTLYAPGTVFGTSAHFSWVPMYATQSFRDWLFLQKK